MAYKVSDYRTSLNYYRAKAAEMEAFLANPGHPLTPVLEASCRKQLAKLRKRIKAMED